MLMLKKWMKSEFVFLAVLSVAMAVAAGAARADDETPTGPDEDAPVAEQATQPDAAAQCGAVKCVESFECRAVETMDDSNASIPRTHRGGNYAHWDGLIADIANVQDKVQLIGHFRDTSGNLCSGARDEAQAVLPQGAFINKRTRPNEKLLKERAATKRGLLNAAIEKCKGELYQTWSHRYPSCSGDDQYETYSNPAPLR